MKSIFSNLWKSSIQRRKQRKYRYNAPLHIRQKFIRAHLSKELRQKYNKRSIGIRVGDKIKVMRGQFKGKSGKVEKVDLKKSKIFVAGIESVRREGSKAFIPLEPSNLLLIELNLNDKKRKVKLTGEKEVKEEKKEPKKTTKPIVKETSSKVKEGEK